MLLKTADGNSFLPIWIGHPEAAAILMKLQGASTPRPMTHDLLSEMLSQLDAKCERVSVTELRDNTFYAVIHMTVRGEALAIDARPSDAIALALRTRAPILVSDEVIDNAKTTDLVTDRMDTDRLQRWLESLDPEELGKYKM